VLVLDWASAPRKEPIFWAIILPEFSRTTTTSQLRNFALAVAALASMGGVISGIALSKGDLWSRGDFGWHHRFVWPAFRLVVVRE